MIGLFDSGFGGLQTLTYFKQHFPTYDYVFLADQGHYPYGEKTPNEVRERTFLGLQWLFDQGVHIAIIACNTASAFAIRPRQQTYPHLKTLSVTIPAVEKIIALSQQTNHIGIIATNGTILSGVYPYLFTRRGGKPGTSLHLQMAPDLVDMVERGETDKQRRIKAIKKHIAHFPKNTETLVLGCTHFPVLIKEFQQVFDGTIIDPALEAVEQFSPYLHRHPDITENLTTNSSIKLYTTGNTEHFQQVGQYIFDDVSNVQHVEI